MNPSKVTAEEEHPIRVVARRTGLTPEVLRSWEKRYAAVEPARRRGRRYYSSGDLERLLLLRRATLGGRSIGQVARLETEELRDLVAADEEAARRAPGSATAGARGAGDHGETLEASQHLERCLEAVVALDPEGLERALERATLDLSQIATMEHVVAPLMERVGDLWHAGRLRIAHEHVTAAVVRTFLGSMGSSRWASGSTARLVAATPAGQAHELGALVVGTTAAAEGWAVTYLGADLPAEEIAAAARARRARVVALSIVHPADDPRLGEELRRLARLLPDGTALILGGGSAAAYYEDVRPAGARLVRDLPAFRAFLGEVRNSGISRGPAAKRARRARP